MYGRLALANKDMEPELVCMSADNRSSGFGELEGGLTFTTSLAWAHRCGERAERAAQDECDLAFTAGWFAPTGERFGWGGGADRLLAPDCAVASG